MVESKDPRGVTVLFADGTWRYYPGADEAVERVDDEDYDGDRGAVILYDVSGDVLEEFTRTSAIAWSHAIYLKWPPPRQWVVLT